MRKVLTIAGSDCSGGAGIQADIKTITAHGMYAMSVITALTAQNTTGVYGISDCTAEFIGLQMDCIFKDIRPDAVKIGMVSNIEIIKIIADKLKEYKADNIVVDPVMVATSGSKLISDVAVSTLRERLFPIAAVITPNLPEAECLTGMNIKTTSDMEAAASILAKEIHGGILIKGGHLDDTADDLLLSDNNAVWIRGSRVDNPNTHGTGCTFSSAIACGLAMGKTMEQAVRDGKAYLTGALYDMLDLGQGSGPLNHCYNIRKDN